MLDFMNIINRYFRNTSSFISFICLFLIIYFNNETLANNLCTFVSQPCQYVAIFAFIVFLIRFSHKKLIPNSSTFVFAITMSTCVCVAGLFDRSFSNGYILTVMNLFLASFMVSMISFNDFKKYYIAIIVFLCVCSILVTYIVRPVLPMLSLQHVVNSAQLPFTNAIVCYVVDYEGYLRNTGIFREAGVWGAFVILAIMMLIPDRNLYTRKKYSFYLIVMIITVLSTFSTACMLALGLYFIVAILTKQLSLRHNKFVIVLTTAVVVLILGNIEYLDMFNQSLDKLSVDSSSYQARTNVYANALPMVFSNILGHGILNGASGLMTGYDESTFHNTSTIVTSCVYFGVFFFGIYFYGFIRFCKKRLVSLLFIIPLLIILNAEQYIFNPIFYMLVFYGIAKDSQYYEIVDQNESPLDNEYTTA